MSQNDKKIRVPSLVLPLLLGVAGHGCIALAQSPGTFAETAAMTTPRARHTATLLTSGKVLITGGYGPTGFSPPLATAELFDPSTGSFTPTGSMSTPRAGHTATLLADGTVLIAGGRSGIEDLATAELYDPSSGTFASTGSMNALRGLNNAALLADGRVLVAGCSIPCNSGIAEIYNPAAGAFATAGNSRTSGGTVTLVADSRVLTTGGGCSANGGNAQLFDPGVDLFSFTGLFPNACDDINNATLLTNGKVLFAGNEENDGTPAAAELYDPAAGTFANLGHTIGPHEYSASILIPDGTVLISGGQLPGGNGVSGAELYTPTTGTFSLTGSMTAGRHEHTATLLPDGTILIAGGYSLWPSSTASAEVYHPAVLVSAPLLFSLWGDGKGQGAIWHADTGQVASAENPAIAGEALSMYTAYLVSGGVIPPQVAVGGQLAEVLYFGGAPGYPGYNQVNFALPNGVPPGLAVPVRLTYIGRPSNEVTIGVR